MTPAAKGGAALGGGAVVAAGGYGTKVLLEKPKLISLEGDSEYGEEHKETKFGAKYAADLLSTKDERNNKEWERRVVNMSNGTSLSGHLSSAYVAVQSWSGDNGETKASKFQTAVNSLKTGCKGRYDDSTVNKPDSNADRWDEVWTYCSLWGVNKWKTNAG